MGGRAGRAADKSRNNGRKARRGCGRRRSPRLLTTPVTSAPPPPAPPPNSGDARTCPRNLLREELTKGSGGIARLRLLEGRGRRAAPGKAAVPRWRFIIRYYSCRIYFRVETVARGLLSELVSREAYLAGKYSVTKRRGKETNKRGRERETGLGFETVSEMAVPVNGKHCLKVDRLLGLQIQQFTKTRIFVGAKTIS